MALVDTAHGLEMGHDDVAEGLGRDAFELGDGLRAAGGGESVGVEG